MSVACESIASEDDVSHTISNTQNMGKDAYEEELDYEEEMDDGKSGNNNLKHEDGELSDNDISEKVNIISNKNVVDKDEGELDEDEDLEEGEVKEEEEENAIELKPEFDDNDRSKPLLSNDERGPTRHDAQKHSKTYYNNSNWANSTQNSNYGNSRYATMNRNDRYSNNRTREYNNPPALQSTSESAWERGLKQARELLSKASKRKEEEVDFDNKRFNLTVDNNNIQQQDQAKSMNRDMRDRSPIKRRRHSSQNSSSEDEIERRHRLAYDAAPWNNQNSSNYQSSNYRNKTNYSSNRSAETYRDPWRRSKSPKLPVNRSRRQDGDTRYGEISKKDKLNNSDLRRSNSMSSLSSIGSNSSKLSGSDKSSGKIRKLPYARPNLEAKDRYERQSGELPYRNDYSRTRMDRIPKKSNASPRYQSNERISETKSFDSWSESLSDSDSSSFFSNSDSDSEESDVEAHDKSNRISKKLSDKRSQSKAKKQESKIGNSSLHVKQFNNRDSNIESKTLAANSKISARVEKETNKKPPIKMTFMKTQPSLKKDRLIDEQLNGETLELDDFDANISRSPKLGSSGKSTASKSQSEDEESKKRPRVHKDSSSSSTSSTKVHRREELLLKLKAVEEAIERKLNSKKE